MANSSSDPNNAIDAPVEVTISTPEPSGAGNDDESATKDGTTSRPKHSFLKLLLRFTTRTDRALIALGLFAACCAGSALPLMTIIFGSVSDSLGGFQVGLVSSDALQSQISEKCLYFVYLGIAMSIFTYLYVATLSYTAENSANRLRKAYFEAILHQEIAYFDNEGGGSFSTRMIADTQLVQDGIGEKVSMFVMSIAQFISAFVIAFTKSWQLTLVLICAIPLMFLVLGFFRRFILLYSTQSLEKYALAGNIAEEALGAIRTLRAFSASEKLANVYQNLLLDAEQAAIKRQAMTGVVFGSLTLIIYSIYSLAFYYGGTLLIDGKVTPGEILTCFFAVLIGSFAISGSSREIMSMGMALGAGSGLLDMIDRKPDIDPYSPDGQCLEKVVGHIAIENITFQYPARPQISVIDDLSLDIETAKSMALVGYSGGGKSSILQLIERFYDPNQGCIKLDGVDIRDLNVRWLRRQIGYVTQEPVLFKNTIFENVAHGLIGSPVENAPPEEKRIIIEEACKNANAHDFIMSLPKKYETQIGERGLLLSGGQKQRIAIARAIVKNPKILLLDEATSALDTQSEKVVQLALEKASAGRTTIIIAHRLSTIRNAHKIVVMSNGKIVETGNHISLMAISDGHYRKMVETQQVSTGEDNVTKKPEFESIDPDKVHLVPADSEPETEKHGFELESEGIELKKVNVSNSYQSESAYRDASSFALFWHLMRLNAPEGQFNAVGIVGSVIGGGIMPAFAVIFGNVLQVFYEKGDKLRQEANFWALMFFVMALIGMIGNILKFLMFGISGEKLTTRVRDMGFRAMLKQEIGWFDEECNSVGQLTTSLSSNAQQIQNMSGQILGSILELLVSISGAIIVSLIFGWKLGLVVLACLPLSIIANKARMDILRKGNLATKDFYEKSAQVACEAIGAIRTVAALTREKDLNLIYAKDLEVPLAIGHHHAKVGSLLYAISQSFSVFINALAFWYGSQLFIYEGYDVRQMFVILMASIFAGQNTGTVFSMIPDLSKAMLYAKDFLVLINRNQRIKDDKGETIEKEQLKGRIEFKDVEFEYPTRPGIKVLKGLSIAVDPGQYVALVGSSGCGKSTTVGLVQRFYDIKSGSITIDGKPLTALNLTSLRKSMTIVSQEPSLFDMTIRQNICLGIPDPLTVHNEDLFEAARNANIHDFIESLPEKYETRIGGRGSQLSGGQKQRIAIARALLLKPKILLLDEATSALDSKSEQAVQQTLDQAAKGRTTISIAHRLSTIKDADRIYVFQSGRVIEYGTHEQLIALNGLYHTLVAQQDLNR